MYNVNQSKSSKSEKVLKVKPLELPLKKPNLIQSGPSSPLAFLEDRINNLLPSTRRVLNELVKLDNNYPSIFVCHKRLASLCGMSPRSVFTKLHELKEDGFITIEWREYDTCIYKVATILRDPVIRSRLCRWLRALLFIPVCYLSFNIHAEKIKVYGNTMFAKVDFCDPILNNINNNTNSSRQSHWYKESPYTPESVSFQKKIKEKKYLALERDYFEIVGQGLTEDQWKTFASWDERFTKQALLRLNTAYQLSEPPLKPFGFLCGIMKNLTKQRKPIKSSASRAPVCPTPKKIQASPLAQPVKILKREIHHDPLPANNPWAFPYPW
jgi:hypothetical protein